MNFHVIFKAQDSNYVKKDRQIGLDDVRRIRSGLNADLPLERISSITQTPPHSVRPGWNSGEVKIVVSEAMANKVPQFSDRNGICVQVTGGEPRPLSKFCKEHVCWKQNPETCEITEAWIGYDIDESSLLSAWIGAGCPETFNVDGLHIDGASE